MRSSTPFLPCIVLARPRILFASPLKELAMGRELVQSVGLKMPPVSVLFAVLDRDGRHIHAHVHEHEPRAGDMHAHHHKEEANSGRRK